MRIRKRKKPLAGDRYLVTLGDAPAAVVFASSEFEAKRKYPVGIVDTEHRMKARKLRPLEKIKTTPQGIVIGSIPKIKAQGELEDAED